VMMYRHTTAATVELLTAAVLGVTRGLAAQERDTVQHTVYDGFHDAARL